MTARKSSLTQFLYTAMCWAQGVYYALFGAWPLVHMDSFLMVTGEKGKYDHLGTGLKADHWLVYSVGGLIVAIATPLLIAAVRRTRSLEVTALGILSAGTLMAVDIIYTRRRVIEPIYLLDAAIELVFVLVWVGILLVHPVRVSSSVENEGD